MVDQTADQAERLRGLIRARENPESQVQTRPPAHAARVITVTSGKGGVGKSNITLNLTLQFLKRGKRAVIIDADFGLANIEVLLGVTPKYHFGDVLAQKVSMERALTTTPTGIKFLSGGSGMASLVGLNEKQLAVMTAGFGYLDAVADIILIDTGAGMGDSVMSFVKASSETILVTTPDPTSVTDAYAIVKNMQGASRVPSFKVIVNRAENYREGAEIYEKLARVSERFLGIPLEYLGTIPYDQNLVRAVKRQEPVTLCHPDTECSRCIIGIAMKLLDIDSGKETARGFSSFFRRLIGK